MEIVPRLHFSATDVRETSADTRTDFISSIGLSDSINLSEDVQTDTNSFNLDQNCSASTARGEIGEVLTTDGYFSGGNRVTIRAKQSLSSLSIYQNKITACWISDTLHEWSL